ncbi:MAG: hypothetical protein E5Y01_16195 [Mesorhizobium sp.]|uniref:hypothetical protein n=1 Tax=Mesorhizobium sp. TaxID=1871066 RepID=UPI0012098C9D|nr:hypothetical protein [Mesorhizobium sp.]TJV51128.1 MAG: hypothetical protein E5Y01_16195 [Mesorhizobium sp.]
MMTPPRAEELLSYITGLGPVGQAVTVNRDVAMADIRIGNSNTYYECLRYLIGGGFVQRIGPRTYAVLRRPEEFA